MVVAIDPSTSQSPLPSRSREIELAAVLHALSDPQRLHIVRELAADTEPRPCGTIELGVAKSTMTHHFRVLRESGRHPAGARRHDQAHLAAARGPGRTLPGPSRRGAQRLARPRIAEPTPAGSAGFGGLPQPFPFESRSTCLPKALSTLAGLPLDGRGWFRTSDLSRVKRQS